MDTYVYVINKDGEPLMPTTRCGHVRILLKQRKAVVVERKPFTIQLLYECENKTQRLLYGNDPGRTNIGVCVVKEDGTPVFAANVETRNKDIPTLMAARKKYRQQHRHQKRRCKRQRRALKAGTYTKEIIERKLPGCEKSIICHYIKNKEARFNNRKRPNGWLTPTARQLLQTYINLLIRVSKFLPITDVVMEVNKFAFMELDDPNVRKWQYAKGPLYKKGSVDNAVYEQQHGHCIFCKNEIDAYHHIIPVSKYGSDTLQNKAGLCERHHHLVHTEDIWKEKLKAKKAGLNKKYGALSVLNQIIPYLVKEYAKLYPTYITDGRSTKEFREDHNLKKDHYIDAYCIACSILNDPETKETEPYHIKQYRRHDRQACHQEMVDRKYYLNDKVIAVNRHKRKEQFADSLEEYRKTHSEAEVSKLKVRPHPAAYKNMDRVMPGALMVYEPRISKKDKEKGIVAHNIIFIFKGSNGTHDGKPDYYISENGKRYSAGRCKALLQNRGLIFI